MCELEDIYSEDEPETCFCGHFPINELCFLNVCVKKFLGLPSDKIFDAVNRITKDSETFLLGAPETRARGRKRHRSIPRSTD